MDRLKRLYDRRAAIAKEQEAMLAKAADEDRPNLSEDEEAKYQALDNEATEVAGGIEREEALAERIRGMRTVPNMAEPVEEKPAEERPKFESFGHFLQAAWRASLPGSTPDPRLRRLGAASGLSEGVASDGGFLVDTDYEAGIFKKMHDTGKVWAKCRNIPISSTANSVKIRAIDESSRVAGSRLGGVRGYWLNEGGTKTASDPKFRIVELNLKKLIGLAYATDELLEDAAALESVLMQGFAEEMGFMLDDAVINGTGAGQPLGLLNSTCLVSVNKETGQAATTIVAENIEKMYSRMWAPSLGNAVWLINQDCWPQIFQLSHSVGTGGVPMFVPGGGLTDSPAGTLLGRPIMPIEQCQTLGTKGDIYFADLSQYVTATKGGLQSASSIHVKFTTDETTFRWVYRADGSPLWESALTPYKGSNTQSPFIALAVRS